MIVKEVPYREPRLVFESLRRRPYSFFLDSGMDPQRLGRYSLLGSDPFLVFKVKGEQAAFLSGGQWHGQTGDPYLLLRALLARFRAKSDPRLPVTAGAFGYFAYDFGRQLARRPLSAGDDLGLPDCYLGFYDRLVIIDQRQKQMFLTSTGLPARGEKAVLRARRRRRELESLLADSSEPGSDRPEGAVGPAPTIYGHFTEDSYRAAVEKVIHYINRGEAGEVILSQRFSCRLESDPWSLYLRLRQINPAPFAAYLHYPELALVCASPERFLKVSGGRVETRPIKGTRPRGRNPAEDRRLRNALLQSDKDKAELAAITTLALQELKPVCRRGSVQVWEHFRLEEYPTVFHLVATVRGRLAPGRDVIDLLQAAFPAGSISGAPRRRAMEIIEELEPVKRGIYTGSIGYLGFDGNVDLNVVIRTIIIKDGTAYLQVGGGIVGDSRPGEEYRETITKARALLKALGHKGAVRVCPKQPG